MSGFEVAGIVLGAFPLAMSALEKYGEVAKRLKFWLNIQLEYKKCMDDLNYQHLCFQLNLKELLLPLVPDDKIRELLADPGGECWQQQDVSHLLEDRLRHSHSLYVGCIEKIRTTMDRLNAELACYSDPVREGLKAPKESISLHRVKHMFNRRGLEYQYYRLKFSNGEATRNSLLSQLENSNSKLEKLLSKSDTQTKLLQKRKVQNPALCTFWVQAQTLFRALAAAWNCCCSSEHHYARLLLQHRTDKKVEFNVIFAKSLPSAWDIRKTIIKEEVGWSPTPQTAEISTFQENLVIRQPNHRQARVTKSALRVKGQSSYTKCTSSVPSITLSAANPEAIPPSTIKSISSLCESLAQGKEPCYGYLSEENSRYYIYQVSKFNTKAFTSITLDQILRGHARHFKRSQRTAVAFILASSFLQLLDTPWLPASWARSDIVFISDESDPATFPFDQPHICRAIAASPSSDVKGKSQMVWSPETAPGLGGCSDGAKSVRSLRLLGILLMELCFGKLLEDQQCRKDLPAGRNDVEQMGFDILAALEWQAEVIDEAGPDYADAVGWCFGPSGSSPGDAWRQEMLRNVVQPLERCYLFLRGEG